MKILLPLLAAASLGAATPLPDFTSRKTEADTAVLFVGSDWCPPGKPYQDRWSDPAFASDLPADLQLVLADVTETSSEEKIEPEIRPRTYPALAYFDAGGRLVGMIEGASDLGGPSEMDKRMAALRALREQRDAIWKEADSLEGAARARKLGEGMVLLNLPSSAGKDYASVLAEIQKTDPKDESGYTRVLNFSGHKLTDMAVNSAKDGTQAEAEATLIGMLRDPALNPTQKQEILAATYALYSRWPERKDKVKPTLEALRDVAPDCELGKAAANYLKHLSDLATSAK